MRKIALSLAILGTSLLPVLCTAPAQAQPFNRTWVSNTGNDSAACSVTAPCLTFAGAYNKTSSGGEINCLTPGGFGTVTIEMSITIDCHNEFASIQQGGISTVIVIDVAGGVVTLRNINFDGLTTTSSGIIINSALTVYIEDAMIMNFANSGILDEPTGGGTRLFVKNSIIQNNGGPGVVAKAGATNAVVLENVHLVGNGYGVAAATGNNVVVSRSVVSGNATAGVEADPGAQVSVDNTEITHNIGYGIEAFGTITLANSDIVFNSTGISGATVSYGNNRIFGNPSAGPAPTRIGAVSTDYGQQ